MFQSFIILFRETLEAALILGIVLGYLRRSGELPLRREVYLGLLAGVVASVAAAALFQLLAGGFTGRAEQIFEGLTMLVGAVLLSTVILWMMRRAAGTRQELERKVEERVTASRRLGLFLLVFFAVLREGIEAVIFLAAAHIASPDQNLLGAMAGMAAAALLAFALFRGLLRVNLRGFFTVTNLLLILFAAGLVARGAHELQEAGLIPVVIEHLWEINPPVLGDDYPLLHERGYLGSIAAGLFGYNGDPSLIEVITYVLYLAAALLVWLRIRRASGASSGN